MTEKAFRLDFFIAIAALLISAVSAFALIYQTHVIGDQYAATIWPYISSNASAGPQSLGESITNDGLGPALVRSAQLIVDGKPVAGWNDYFKTILADAPTREYFLQVKSKVLSGQHFGGSIKTASLGPGRTIRPGDTATLLEINLPDAPMAVMNRHTIALKLCYCSLNKSCWMLDTSNASAPQDTQSVATCTSSASIGAAAFMSPSGPPRRK